MRLFAILILFLYSLPSTMLYSQRLEPKVDRRTHAQGVECSAFSKDGRFLALGNAKGQVTIHHAETGKAIQTLELEGSVLDVQFVPNEDVVLMLLGPRHDEDEYHATARPAQGFLIQSYSLVDQKLKTEIRYPSTLLNSRARMNLSPEARWLTIWDGTSGVIIIDRTNHSVYDTLEGEGLIATAFSGPNTLLTFYTQNARVVTRHYDIVQKIEESAVTDQAERVIAAKGEKIILLDGEVLTLWNTLLGKKVNISSQELWDQDRSPPNVIHPEEIVGFTHDDEFLRFVLYGGTATYMTAVIGALPKSYSSATAVYYDSKDHHAFPLVKRESDYINHLIVNAHQQPNGEVLFVDEIGNQQQLSYPEGSILRTLMLPRFAPTSLDINGDFSTLAYSILQDGTYSMSVPSPTSVNILSPKFLRYLYYNDEMESAGGYTFSFGREKLSHFIWDSPYKTPDSIPYILDLKDFKMSQTGGVKVYDSDILSNYFIMPDTVIVDAYEEEAGSAVLSVQGQELYFRNKDDIQWVTSGKTVARSLMSSTVVLDENESYVLKSGAYSRTVDVSYDGKFVSMNCSSYDGDSTYSILFNTVDRNWDHIRRRTGISPRRNIFDDDSPWVVTLGTNGGVLLWDTKMENDVQSMRMEQEVLSVAIDQRTRRVYLATKVEMHIFDFDLKALGRWDLSCLSTDMTVSPDGRGLCVYNKMNGKAQLWKKQHTDLSLDEKAALFSLVREWSFTGSERINENLYNEGNPIYWKQGGGQAFLFDGLGSLELINLDNGVKLINLELYPGGEWLCYNPQGYFDASPKARHYLYYHSGTEPLMYDQIKEKYWVPGLFEQVIHGLPSVQTYDYTENIPLYPLMENIHLDTSGKISLDLKPRNGGMGRVALFVNGKEVEQDINPERSLFVTFDLGDFEKYLFRENVNSVEVQAFNSEGWLGSRRKGVHVQTHLARDRGATGKPRFGLTTKKPESDLVKPAFYGLFVGSSKYRNPKLNLTFADKDAQVLQEAFLAIGEDLYDWERSKSYVLYSEAQNTEHLSNKANIQKVLQDIASQAQPQDVLVLFFSGHGLTLDQDFYYLMSGSGNTDLENDLQGRDRVTFSSKEINNSLRKIAASKQILIIDACHSGKIADVFSAGSKANTSSQEKALEDLQDKTGVYVLASSESNQKSYETDVLSQGFLTYTLLDGMSGSCLNENEEIINVMDLLSYSTHSVEDLSQRILGKRQKPVLAVAQRANTFPVGLKSDRLKVKLPSEKWPMGRPGMIRKDSWDDPQNLTSKLLDEIQRRGSIEQSGLFYYTKNATLEGLIRISGIYQMADGQVRAQWNVLKNEEVWIHALETSVDLQNADELPSRILNLTESRLKAMRGH